MADQHAQPRGLGRLRRVRDRRRYVHSTGEIANITLVNLATFIGAVCFFVGAALLPVESSRDADPERA
jgi:hypothetical protein